MKERFFDFIHLARQKAAVYCSVQICALLIVAFSGIVREVARPRRNNYDVSTMDQFAAEPMVWAADLAVNSDYNAVLSNDYNLHRRIQLARTAKNAKHKPKYIRMLTDSGAFSVDIASGAAILDDTEMDLDISLDGKHWHHFFGKKCFHNKSPLGLEVPNEGDFAPIKKSDN
jgi:hypothetical protein